MFGRPRAIRAHRPAAPVPGHGGGPQLGTVTGWAPFGYGQHASNQIGAFAGQLLNQYPANIPGVQLDNGRQGAGVGSRWYYPSLTAIPNGSLQQTQRPNNVIGGQRYGSRYSGGIGPVTAKRNAAALTAAQVRQSGLAAMQWAQGLNLGTTPGG
jgi:hypothetical protein